ncbi:vitamin K epoxide reductase family protein [Aquimarina macrocephali]|uniref:vitamin K epoxide reductase family protein n=1 Tax=Aquimarina macrocephali TaxID=666563 RepID=UPI003F667CC6
MDQTVLKILLQLKRELSLEISNEKLESLLLSHQDYPSIFSFSDTLKKIGVENKAGRISSDQLLKLSPIFLAYSIEDGLVIVTKISNAEICYYSGNSNDLIIESFESFLQKWNGIVLLIDTDAIVEMSNEDLARQKLKRTKHFGALSLLAILITISIKSYHGVFNLFLLTKLAGTLISLLIVYTEVSIIHKSKFCKSNDHISCEGVLNSGASKIFPWLSMSDLGLLYFLGSFIAVCIASMTSNFKSVAFLISILSFFAFPYIFFSIYYQYRIVKKWCVLCLAIQGVFFIETILSSYFLFNNNFESSINGFLIPGISFSLIIIIWSYLKSPVYKYFLFKESMYKYARLKNNPEVFSLLQEKENLLNTAFNENHIIFEGAKDIDKRAALVINPYCHLCAKEFQKILEINKTSEGINFSLIFSDTDSNEISQFLIELYYKMTKSEFLSVLSKWFEHKNLNTLKEKYAIEISEKSRATYAQHKKWCTQNNILQTPLTIFNNRKLSDHYAIEDLITF